MTKEEVIAYIHSVGFDTDGTLGKHIQLCIQNLDANGMSEIADHLLQIYPQDKFAANFNKVNHIKTSIVFRTIFGDLTRNGVMLEYTHPDRKDGLLNNTNLVDASSWSKSFEFSSIVENKFKEINNNYGLLILYEMLGHRYGDLAVVSDGDETNKYIQLMEKSYKDSISLANDIKCMKQMFSPWYWGALYFTKLGINEKAAEWHKNHNICAMKYMNDGRGSYTEKIILSLNMLKKIIPQQDFRQFIISLKKQCSNSHYSKALHRGKFV